MTSNTVLDFTRRHLAWAIPIVRRNLGCLDDIEKLPESVESMPDYLRRNRSELLAVEDSGVAFAAWAGFAACGEFDAIIEVLRRYRLMLFSAPAGTNPVEHWGEATIPVRFVECTLPVTLDVIRHPELAAEWLRANRPNILWSDEWKKLELRERTN